MGSHPRALLEIASGSKDGTAHDHHQSSEQSQLTYGSTSSNPNPQARIDIDERRRLVRCKKSGALPYYNSSDASRIRSRYLHRLGLGLEPPNDERSAPSFGSKRYPSSVAFLKEDYGKEDESIRVGSPPVHSNSPIHRRRKNTIPIVSFEPSVVVHAIPSRNAYSKRVRNALFMQRSEYEETVAKNSIEFLSEGCDPEKVLDEEDFIRLDDGELVHPVHLLLGYPALLRKLQSL